MLRWEIGLLFYSMNGKATTASVSYQKFGIPAVVVTFFACPKKVTKKRAPEMDYIPISGWFPDVALVLL